jgi:hypothetical protein
VQQKVALFDHLVGEGENVRRNLQAESLAVLRLPCTSKSGFIREIPARINRGQRGTRSYRVAKGLR